MKAVLESIKFLVICDNEQPTISNSLRGTSGPVDGCLEAMKNLETLFRTETQPQRHGMSGKLKDQALVTLATLAWPLKESKARKLMQDLAAYKSTIGLGLAADTAHLMRDTARKTTQIQEALSESQRHEVFKWLVDVDPSSLHHRAQKNYEPGTCDWAESLPEWHKYLGGRERCLWVHGIPGAGKTILASRLIEKIENHCEVSTSEKLLSIYYYCYFGHNQDEASSLLKWILNRLCREADGVSDHLWRLFKHGGAPSLTSLLTAVERALEPFHTVYVTIDAIDESSPREDLLKIIRDLATDLRFHKIRLLLTSREYFDIEKILIEFSSSISMRNPFLDADIYHYTQSRLQREGRTKQWPEELQQQAVEALSRGAKGM
ncbi:Vegetative incompatibility protein HET-E-1 [Colletotrichum tropicale]|nr:Vegetative incompatibility protein HET-E-1 [Colletotrichum tropicale]